MAQLTVNDLDGAIRILGAALGGAAIGVERQRSGHASGPRARFAGVRTFTMLGGFAGVTGWLFTLDAPLPAVVLLAGAAALVVAAYVAASRNDVDGTTEVAALIVLAAGFVAGTGRLPLASGIIAVTTFLLVEKSRLHALVARLDDTELGAAARFAVMAVVILPLLPPGPYGPLGGVRPRELWTLVLLFSGLSFAGYVARRLVGDRGGYVVAGLLGGLISSTAVTLTFARLSRDARGATAPLALGVLAACTVMFVRVAVATAILNPPLAVTLFPYLVAPFVVGAAAVVAGLPRMGAQAADVGPPANPLQIWPALQMTALFQLVLFGVHAARRSLGEAGLLLSGAVLGLTDVDALTISMARTTATGVSLETAALAVAIGLLSNTVLKLGVALLLGSGRFRRLASGGLVAMAAASAASIGFLGGPVSVNRVTSSGTGG